MLPKSFAFYILVLLSIAVMFNGCGDDDDYSHELVIIGVTASPDTIGLGRWTTLTCNADDNFGYDITYTWNCEFGSFADTLESNNLSGTGTTYRSPTWYAPDSSGVFVIHVLC